MKVVKGTNRRYPYRSLIPTALLLGILLPFVFIRSAFLALEAGATLCPSISCVQWTRFLWGSDPSLDLMKELRRAYMDETMGGSHIDPANLEAAPESLDDLIVEMGSSSSYEHFDIKMFVLKTKAMLLKMDQKVQTAKLRALYYRRLASIGIPKSMHCLNLRMAEEYSVNAAGRSSLPPPEYASRLTNSLYLHIALITDNVLAAAVAVSSTLKSSANPSKIVFHIVTDKKTYNSMHAWFALHPTFPGILEVKGLHQFDWPPRVNALIMRTVDEIHKSSFNFDVYNGIDKEYRRLEALKPSTLSILNYMKIHLPQLFPKLDRVIVLDDDVVVRKELNGLWDLNLKGNVVGAVGLQESDGFCGERELGDYLNYSNPILSSPSLGIHRNQCAWSWGVNVFDLKAWRRTDITQTYQFWLRKAKP
ncbi:probable galacturonosyltransferase 15 isoform X2 [Ananas comosus]|uniref:Hexosyltransferase n=1 Tax=Ananas comosus TaxID=4615 RepID=A0A6P5G1T8_ANACO|nr:probable galacturonosyltransferase 15 isoform X2 [Ananas comosus]